MKLCTLKRESRLCQVAPTTTTYGGAGRNSFQRTLSHGIGSSVVGGGASTTPAAAAAAFSSVSVESPVYTAINAGCAVGNSTGTAGLCSGFKEIAEGSVEMQKIKKVQSFFRGWLCRRRWKQIVEQYIKSPHAESMRKRNRLDWRGTH